MVKVIGGKNLGYAGFRKSLGYTRFRNNRGYTAFSGFGLWFVIVFSLKGFLGAFYVCTGTTKKFWGLCATVVQDNFENSHVESPGCRVKGLGLRIQRFGPENFSNPVMNGLEGSYL